MNYDQFLERFRACAPQDAYFEYGEVTEAGRAWPLVGLRTEGKRELVITSGFHGEEPAGPITLAEHLPELLSLARGLEVGLRIYPCINPSGFEARTRYNMSGEKPNNDFMRYEVAPGVWKDTLPKGEAYLRWVLYDGGPKETRAIRDELAKGGVPDAALDLHQDHHLLGEKTYAYVFGPHEAYLPLVAASERHVPVARSLQVDVGITSDPDGLIEFNDGSVTDFYWRRGTPYCAALETTTRTPQSIAAEVNLVWIRGFLALAANRERKDA